LKGNVIVGIGEVIADGPGSNSLLSLSLWISSQTPRPVLPGKAILFYIVPVDPAYRARLAGHVPVNYENLKGGYENEKKGN
jgi:hypothetical protein